MKHKTVTMTLITIVTLFVSPVMAQTPNQKRNANPYEGVPLEWSVEAIMDQFISHMTRYYDLNERQEKYTRQLMTKRVKRFLADYEQDVRWMAFEMWDYQMKGEIPPVEIVKEWGRRGQPLMAAIRNEIIDGNMRWREILDEEQRAKHDKDLELLTRQFDELESKAERWSKGIVEEGDFPGTVSRGAHQFKIRQSEHAWKYYVRKFIQDYNLDESQQQTAYSLLNELRREAARYRKAHDSEFAAIESEEEALRDSKRKIDPEERKQAKEAFEKLQKRRQELEKPISEDMFGRLKRDLQKIPTLVQRRAYEERMEKLNRLASRTVSTQPADKAPAPSEEPADTQPAVGSSSGPPAAEVTEASASVQE